MPSSAFNCPIAHTPYILQQVHMRNDTLKSILGWFIIASQTALFIGVFVLSTGENPKLKELENCALLQPLLVTDPKERW